RIEDASLMMVLQQISQIYLLLGLQSVQFVGDVKDQQDWRDKLNDEQKSSVL
ncbi:hypothetical protein L917_14770, partial [Phytophthora nicotianae]